VRFVVFFVCVFIYLSVAYVFLFTYSATRDKYYLRARATGKLLNVNDLLNGLSERYNRFKRGEVSSRTESSDWELDALIDFDAETSLPSSSTSVSPAFYYI